MQTQNLIRNATRGATFSFGMMIEQNDTPMDMSDVEVVFAMANDQNQSYILQYNSTANPANIFTDSDGVTQIIVEDEITKNWTRNQYWYQVMYKYTNGDIDIPISGPLMVRQGVNGVNS